MISQQQSWVHCVAVPAMPQYLQEQDVESYLKNTNCPEKLKDFIKQMEQEMRKDEPCPAILQRCMKETFSLRKQDLWSQKLSVRNAIKIYPGLMDYYEVRKDFQRIEKVDPVKFEGKVSYLLKQSAISGQALAAMCPSLLCQDAIHIIRVGEEQRAKKMGARAVLHGCGLTSGDWLGKLVVMESKNYADRIVRQQPVILVRETPFEPQTCDVIVEGVTVLKLLNFFEALMSVYYLFYVFNIDYTQMDEKLFQTFDEVKKVLRHGKKGGHKSGR